MAKYWAFPLVLLISVVAGCQSNKPKTIDFPPPSFSGPTIAQKPAPRVAPAIPPGPVTSAKPAGPRDWLPAAPPRAWRWIVIHHSASPSGSMAVFDKEHKAKGWDG